METKDYAVMWHSTNGRGIPQLPKLCNILHVVSEDAQTAAEIACFKLCEIVTEQFPTFKCKIETDPLEPYNMKIEIFEDEIFIGKIYGLEIIE